MLAGNITTLEIALIYFCINAYIWHIFYYNSDYNIKE